MRVRRASESSICSQTRIEQCLSFENRNHLFDIHARFKFALVVARRPGPTQTVRCSFYLTEFAQIDEPARALDYDMAFIALSGGPTRRCWSCGTATTLRWHDKCSSAIRNLANGRRSMGISLSREMHMTDDAGRFTSISHLRQLHGLGELQGHGYLPLHEGKTIHQFSDQWDTPPRYAVRIAELADKPQTAGERALLPGGMSRNCPIDGRAHRDCGDAAARGVVRSHHQRRAHAGRGGPTRRHFRWSAS